MSLLFAVIILSGSYIASNARIADKSKAGFFAVVGGILLIAFLFSLIF